MDNSNEDQLKTALAAGDFKEAQRLLPAYSDRIAAVFSGFSSRQERQQALESFHNLLSLARVMRAHLSAQISNLQRQSCYRYDGPTAEQHAWHFEA